MLIPVKCFTCGRVLANKKLKYDEMVRERKLAQGMSTDRIMYLKDTTTDKTVEGHVLDELKLFSPCCRTIMITSVNIP